MSSLPCPPAQWSRFSALLDSAMELPEAARGPWLEGLEGEDAGVRPWLARVLTSAASVRTSTFLERPDMAAPEGGFAAGDAVGPYRLDMLLGQGGMGEVWRASRQDDGPRREVALKLPHAELLGGPFRKRFARERDVLAALSHPHIAQLYDAGLSAEGHPYLALELVKGRPITDACRDEGTGLERRVELVRQVLDALSYAHQRLIVHRDIKPSNVLVTPEGGAKLLDFGIAKLLRPTEMQDLLLTQPAAHLATPAYAAPEQLAGGAITVATDIFSVGVLLFELCTGHRPFVTAPIGPDAEAAPLASHRADAMATGMPVERRLARRLRGDMDAVIARALALAPEHRYASAEAFGRDLRRCMEGLPVAARRVGWPARAGKFVRRNRVGVALAVVLAVALVGGTAGVAWQARRAAHERDRANAIKDYLLNLFQQGDPRSGKSSEAMTAQQLLDIAADQADTAFARDPATEIELLAALGGIYISREDATRAERVQERMLVLSRGLYGDADPRVVDGTLNLVNSQMFFLDDTRAKALLEAIRTPVFSRYGPDSPERASWLYARASSLRATHGGWQEAVADDMEALRIFEKYFPGEPHIADVLHDLAGYRYDSEEYAASIALLDQMKAVETAHGTYDAMEKLQYTTERGTDLTRLGRADAAERAFLDAQNQAEQMLGRHSTWYLANLVYRAQLAHMRGDRVRGLALFDQAMANGTGKSASTGTGTAMRRSYGMSLANEGDAAAAIPLLEAALEQTRLHGKDEANLRRSEGALGDAYDKAGRTAEARALLRAARDEWIQFAQPHSTQMLGARERWARFLLDQGEATAAEAEFRAVLAQADKPSGAAALASAGLARAALGRGDVKAADEASAQALRTLQAITMQYDVRVQVEVWRIRAEVLLAEGRGLEARGWAQMAVTAAEEYDAPTSAQLARARVTLAKAG